MKRLAILLLVLSFPMSIMAQQSFSYQGYIESSGTPAHGSYDFQFNLYDAATKGAQIGPIVAQTLTLEEGVFSTFLDFGVVFDGTPLWLQIKVRRAGIGTYETINPRVFLTPAPYAYHSFSADLELPYDGSISYAGSVFWIRNTTPSALARAVRGSVSSSANGSAGVFGAAGSQATSTTTVGPGGVVGTSTDYYGLVGHSTNSSAVIGVTQSGAGVYGLSEGSGTGVYARSTGSGNAFYASADGTGKAAIIDGWLDIGSDLVHGHLDIYDFGQIGVSAGDSEYDGVNGSGISIRDDQGETVVYAGAGNYLEGGELRVVANGANYSSNYAALRGNYSNSGSPGLGLFGAGSTMLLQTEYTGNDAVDFPQNAISPFENLAEAGAANDAQGTLGVVDIGTAVTTILSRTITVPVSGYVIAIAGGTIEASTSASTRLCLLGVSTSAAAIPTRQQNQLSLPAGDTEHHPVTVHGLFSVAAGSTTFYFLGSAGAASIFSTTKGQLTLLFVPTTYGTIDSNDAAAAPDYSNAGRTSGLTEAEMALERAQSIQDNERRIQNELDQIRQRMQELENQIRPDIQEQ